MPQNNPQTMLLYPGESIQVLRRLNEYSLEQLSTLSRIDRKTLEELENSKNNISTEHAEVLAKVLKTFPALLLSWNKEHGTRTGHYNSV